MKAVEKFTRNPVRRQRPVRIQPGGTAVADAPAFSRTRNARVEPGIFRQRGFESCAHNMEQGAFWPPAPCWRCLPSAANRRGIFPVSRENTGRLAFSRTTYAACRLYPPVYIVLYCHYSLISEMRDREISGHSPCLSHHANTDNGLKIISPDNLTDTASPLPAPLSMPPRPA